MRRLYLDARNMEHPVPLEKSIEALRELDNESYFYMLHRKNPVPLIAMVQKQGLSYITEQEHEDLWHILIAVDHDIDLEKLVERLG